MYTPPHLGFQDWSNPIIQDGTGKNKILGGGFQYVLLSALPGEMIQFG